MTIQNSLGLTFEFLENGSIQSINVDPIRISLRASTPFSRSGANIYLRKRTNPIEFTAIIGPESNSTFRFRENGYDAIGSWSGIDYFCSLQLSEKSLSWQWSIEIKNSSDQEIEIDLIHVQDTGLKPINSGLINEYYVSQYLERLILDDEQFGSVICCRQNMQESVGNPWLMIACKSGSSSGSVDGMQFYGKSFRQTGIPESLLMNCLGGEYAGESSILALQEKPIKILPGEINKSAFISTYLADHKDATSRVDLIKLPDLLLEFDDEIPSVSKQVWNNPVKNIFNTANFLPVGDLNDKDIKNFFGEEKRHKEIENGKLLSFFCKENNHVILKAKEILVDRPHAHIIQTNTCLKPNENIVSTNPYAYGVFNSHLTQGNTNFNIFLSVCSSQFMLTPEAGQRVFVKIDGQFYLLGVPSAFEMGLNHCRWIYKFGNHCFQIRTWTSTSKPQVNLDFKELNGNPVDLLVTHDFDLTNGWNVISSGTSNEYVAKPKANSIISSKFPTAQFRILVHNANADIKAYSDEILYSDNKGLKDSLFVLEVPKTSNFCMSFIGEVCSPTIAIKFENEEVQFLTDCQSAQSNWKKLSQNLSLHGEHKDIAAIREILPWYGLNALTHFLTPYGLEQFSGAAWGTRDVSQGPIDFLLYFKKYAEAKEVLRIIFSNQNSDGGWPQWWMFDSYSKIRAHDSHGDVVYWCIIALSNYIKATGDLKILEEVLPYFKTNDSNQIEKTPLSEHVDRLLKLIVDSFIPGTSLVPFGGGDWNDSLQPVSKELAQRMISSWTVEMNYQAFSAYQTVYELTGNLEKAQQLKNICEKIKDDFNKYLIKDGIVAGYGLIEADKTISLLLHPTDTKTGINYSVLPMNRGIISGIFSKEQAFSHQKLIEQFLKGPDGVRLMDRPLKYKGGIQTIFQRAESSTFFGREIGLMYVHEHIRYAESLAITGKAEAFLHALRQAIPVNYRDIVPCGDIRQANCYYSSSDVAFKSRYDADERYDEIKTGNITLRGGWRVYSSGPGIYIGIIVSRLLGLRFEYSNVIFDPVLPKSLNGFTATIKYMGYHLTFKYTVKESNFGPKAISINGKRIVFKVEVNEFRLGGAVIRSSEFKSLLHEQENTIEIEL
jgi:cellobiose phosphorylase